MKLVKSIFKSVMLFTVPLSFTDTALAAIAKEREAYSKESYAQLEYAQGESIDIRSRNLSWDVTDISIPGNGLDMTLGRTYRARTASLYVPKLLGERWHIDVPQITVTNHRRNPQIYDALTHFGGTGTQIADALDYYPNPLPDAPAFNDSSSEAIGCNFNDGKRWLHSFIANIHVPGVSGFKQVGWSRHIAYPPNTVAMFENNWILACEKFETRSKQNDIGLSERVRGPVLISPAGTRYQFGLRSLSLVSAIKEGQRGISHLDGEQSYGVLVDTIRNYYVTDIIDVHGNYLTYEYNASVGKRYVKRHASGLFKSFADRKHVNNHFIEEDLFLPLSKIRSNDNREISLSYHSDGYRLEKVQYTGDKISSGVKRTIRYEYASRDQELLEKVILPNGDYWRYEYVEALGGEGYGRSYGKDAEGYIDELESIKTPSGQTITYKYTRNTNKNPICQNELQADQEKLKRGSAAAFAGLTDAVENLFVFNERTTELGSDDGVNAGVNHTRGGSFSFPELPIIKSAFVEKRTINDNGQDRELYYINTYDEFIPFPAYPAKKYQYIHTYVSNERLSYQYTTLCIPPASYSKYKTGYPSGGDRNVDLNGSLVAFTLYDAEGFNANPKRPAYREDYSYSLFYPDELAAVVTEPRMLNFFDGFKNLVDVDLYFQSFGARVIRDQTLITTYNKDEDGVYQPASYKTEVLTFNPDFGFPVQTKESNSFSNYVKYTWQGYLERVDARKWILGLPTDTYVRDSSFTSNGFFLTLGEKPTTSLTYREGDQDGLVYEEKRYGIWQKRYAEYHLDGNLKKVEYNQKLNDGRTYQYELYEDYVLGIPTSIKKPHMLNLELIQSSRTVNTFGQVARETDFEGDTIYYGYDLLGRLAYKDYAYGYWEDEVYSWSWESGLPVQTVKRCKVKRSNRLCRSSTKLTTRITYDNSLKPIFSDQYDNTARKHIYQRSAYNQYGQLTFQSYPSSSSIESEGFHFDYDGIGRQIEFRHKNGNGDNVTVNTEYLSNNKLRITDQRGNATTTEYLAYGTPSRDQALLITSPEKVFTRFKVNLHGNITSITHAGGGDFPMVFTEFRNYNAQHQLCQTSRLDVGTTVYKPDALGNIQWLAQGQTPSSPPFIGKCNTSAPSSQKVSFTYDNHGNQKQITYGDGTPTRKYTYNKIGQVEHIESSQYKQSYNYNDLGLVTSEKLNIFGDNKTFTLGFGYSGLGHRASITYPDHSAPVRFEPNAFGQSTQAIRSEGEVKTFVEAGATYYPNGSIDSFTFGNGVVHKTLLNDAQYPREIKDLKGTSRLNQLKYTYDSASNINAITSVGDSANSISLMTYDGLNRLKSTTGGSRIGDSVLVYDGLGNIRSSTSNSSLKRHNFTYHYDNVTNVLETISGSTSYRFGYDKRGNVESNGKRSFVYNLANQLISSGSNRYLYDGNNRRIREKTSKGISYSLYSHAGELLYREVSGKKSTDYVYLGNKLVAKDTRSSQSNKPPIASFNKKPIARDDRFSGFAFDDLLFGPLENDSDPDSDALRITHVNTSLAQIINGTSIRYTSRSRSREYTHTFTYTISDGRGGSDTATITLDIYVD